MKCSPEPDPLDAELESLDPLQEMKGLFLAICVTCCRSFSWMRRAEAAIPPTETRQGFTSLRQVFPSAAPPTLEKLQLDLKPTGGVKKGVWGCGIFTPDFHRVWMRWLIPGLATPHSPLWLITWVRC